MKKILIGALTAIMLLSFSAFTEAQVESENICCRGNYCAQECDEPSGEYCGRYGCGQNS